MTKTSPKLRIARNLFLILCLISVNSVLEAQCFFDEDFSSATGWTQVGEDVEIRNKRVEYINGAADGQQRRAYTSLGTTLTSNDEWKAELTFRPESVGNRFGQPWTGHMPLSLTSGTDDPRHDCPDINCTGYPPSKQYGIGLMYTANNPPDGRMYFALWANDSGKNLGGAATNKIYASDLKQSYYIRLERISSTEIKLSVFKDSKYINHLTGSPISLKIPSTITNLNTVQVSNSVSGYYQRELTGWVDDICISSRCAGSDFADAGKDQEICFGETAILEGSQGASYNWSPGTFLNSTTKARVLASPTSNQKYRLIMKDSNGCSDTDYVWVRVREKLEALAEPDSFVNCKGDSIILKGSGGVYYKWSPSENLETPAQANTKAFLLKSENFRLVVYDSFGCSDTAQLPIEVKSTLQAFAGEDKLLCIGDSITLIGSGGEHYSWRSQDSTVSSVTAELNVKPNKSSLYVLEVEDDLGCKSFDSVWVTIIDSLEAKISGDTSICEGDSLRLTASGGLFYLWTSKESISLSEKAQIVVSPSIRTQYKVKVTASSDCQDSASVWVNVGKQAIAGFDLADSLWDARSSYTILNRSVGASSYEWWVQNNFEGYDKDLQYTFTNNGQYVVTLVAKGTLGCNDTLTKTTHYRFIIPMKIPNVLTPNNDHKNDFFFIEGLWEGSSLEVFNRWGQKVYSTDNYQNDWAGILENGRLLSNGTYFYVLESGYKGTIHHGSVLLIR